jgi:prepilin-type N-terminal cleavage/methylation domain-containing protein
MKMKKPEKGQMGFTLVELLVAIAIASLITGGITAAIMQILTINTRASNHMVAVRQVQQAGKEVSKDVLQAQGVNASGSQGFPLTLTWTEWGSNQTNTVVYNLTDMSGGLSQLQRSHTIDDVEQTTALPIVAEYIDPDPTKTSCAWDGNVLVFTVTATVGTESETRIYEVEPRPD